MGLLSRAASFRGEGEGDAITWMRKELEMGLQPPQVDTVSEANGS